MKTNLKKNLIVVALMSSTLTACVVPPQGGMNNGMNNGMGQGTADNRVANQDPCSVGQSAVAGAAIGALLGGLAKGKKGALKGAAAGGIVGTLGCLAINANSRQTRTAAQSDRDYIQSRGRLPAEPQVVSYTPSSPSRSGQRGQPLRVNSVIELVNGSRQPVNEVREELVVFDPQGEPFRNGSKQLTNNTGGRFENTFELVLPESAPQGLYTMKTNLYVNGKLSASKNLQTQIVVIGDGSAPVLMAVR